MNNKKEQLFEIDKFKFISIVAKIIQDGINRFEEISKIENKEIEIEKIKFILKEVIKIKREKMGKKNLEKKVKREFGTLEQNQVEVIEIKENTMQDVNLNELNKFEKIKEYRDLKNINISYGDGEKDKFKDFQKIYSLVSKEIEVQDKKWMYFEKNKIFYIPLYKMFVSKSEDFNYSFYNEESLKKIKEIFDNSKINDSNLDIPTSYELALLRDIKFIDKERWLYSDSKNMRNILSDKCFYQGLGGSKKILGVYKLDKFFNFLENRNKKSNFKNNDLENFYNILKKNKIDINKEYNFKELFSIIDIINDKKVREAFKWVENDEIEAKDFLKECEIYLLENNDLKNFEVILNYNLLDPSIITKEYEEPFNKLVEAYRKYKDYFSCIYNENSEKVKILFDTNKIIDAIRNKEKKFNNIEITYLENQLGIEKEIVYSDKNVYYYKNGEIEEVYNTNSSINYSIYHFSNKDIEERTYQNGILNGKSIFKFSNGDIEEREYKNGILSGKNILRFSNGEIEERNYKNGVLDGEAIYKNGNKEKMYFYKNGVREEMPVLKYYLSIDKERINIDDYQETMLIDPNIGHWDLKEEDKKELKEILGKNVYKKNPKLDINQGGIVAIDFGTKSTVVVYQKDSENILPMRISGDKLNREVRNTDYENPTVIEFRDIEKFLKDYNTKVGRPDTKWEDITVSHTAFGNLTEVSSEYFDSIISDIKQWTASKNQSIVIVDRKGKEILLSPYLELKEKSKNYLDPVELYAYYIGSYINNMINGIYLEYYLSFPVTYEKAIRERILKSFEKGIQKSLPIEIQEDKDIMKKFRVRHGANEPAAFAVCALSKLEIEPKNEEDKIYYGVFDFGGGTTDFDFGIWKYSEEEDLYDYELEHFGAGGERYLGGENILKELAYKVFTDNSSNLRKNKIQYTRPEWCDEISGEETLVSQTKQARQNSTKVAKELRGIWENTTTERLDYISVNLFNSLGEVNAGFKLDIKEDELKNLIKNKIEKGIKNFFIKMEDAFKGEDVKEINIFLAGNSCKHPFVEEIFNRYIEEKKDKLKINIYNTKMFDDLKETNKVNPTAKTGVAFGLIYSRNSGRIKVISRDEKANVNNEVNFKFYVGNNRRNKFNCIISPNSSYDEYKFFGIVKSDIFELYYSTSPEAQTNEMKSSEAKIKRVNLKKDYDEEDRYRIYLKANEADKLVYAIVKEEKDIETKKFIEEGEITLN